MDDTLIFGGLLLAVLFSERGPGAGVVAAGPSQVSADTTTQVVQNKTTAAASTATEVSNDAVIIATDAVDVFGAIAGAVSSDNSDS